MTTVINYVSAFWTVVVMNCIQPVNWEACIPIHEWLLPEIEYAWKIKTGEIIPYQTEKDYLDSIKND
tara:strand:- start:138 stop:338 length:201 start_codon:yes stop_codon:yes gene_type:complete